MATKLHTESELPQPNEPIMCQTRPTMPFPLEEAAPRWNGRAKRLPQFLRQFEITAEMVGLSDEEKCLQLGRYCNRGEDQKFLESLDGYAFPSRNWQTYKKSIWKLYPEVDPEFRYTTRSLDRLVQRTRRKPYFTTAEEYAEFTRDFMKQSIFLLEKNRISEMEVARLFLRGFPTKNQERIEERLEITSKSTNPSFDEIQEAVWSIIRRMTLYEYDEETSFDWDSDTEGSGDSDSENEASAGKVQKKKKRKDSKKDSKKQGGGKKDYL